MLELCQSISSIYYILCHFAFCTSFLLEIVLVTGGPSILEINCSNSSMYSALVAVVVTVQVFLSSSF